MNRIRTAESLISNALQHKIVYQVCKEELAKSEGATERILEEIISKVDKSALTSDLKQEQMRNN